MIIVRFDPYEDDSFYGYGKGKFLVEYSLSKKQEVRVIGLHQMFDQVSNFFSVMSLCIHMCVGGNFVLIMGDILGVDVVRWVRV